jgi:nucleoside 2-deoxyribosyltransferase
MTLKKSTTQKGIFVIMPFVQTPTRDREQLTSFETFNITDEIIKDLFKADIVIADLSGEYPNPNVMYELGVRLILSDKPVILIREKNPNNKMVFDVNSYYIHPYDPLKYSDLEKHLVEKLRRFENGEEQFESPVKKVLHNELILSQSALNSLSISQQKDIVLRGAKFTKKNHLFLNWAIW